MKIKKLAGLAASAAIVSTTIFGVAPAAAAVVQLPPNANGTDNSGIRIFACEDRVIFNVPVNVQRSGGLPYEGEYWDYTTYVTFGEETQYVATQNGLVQDIQSNFKYDAKQPGETIELEFYSEAYGFDATTPFTVEATVVDSDAFAGGNGTRSNPYLISNANQLNLVRCHNHKHFKLTKNLNLAGQNWMPIGHTYNDGYWAGNLNGAGFTISNLTVEDANLDYAGLFGNLQYSSVYDLTLKNADVAGNLRVGGLFGNSRFSSYSDIQISDTRVLGKSNVGAFGGHSDYRSVFSRISVTGEVTGRPFVARNPEDPTYANVETASSIGGVMGYEDGDGDQWEDIKSNTKVSLVVDSALSDFYESNPNNFYKKPEMRYIGGFIGESGEGASYRNIKVKSEISIDVETGVEISYAGGVFGDAERSFIDNVVADTKIDVNGRSIAHQLGGFIGDTYHPVISNSSLTTDINIEVGANENSFGIGGFVGEAYDGGIHDIRSKAKVVVTAVEDADVEDEVSLRQIGGFIGSDEEGNLTAVISDATVRVTEGNGSNNSEAADINLVNTRVNRIGGFVGDRDDYSSYTKVSSNAKVVVGTSNGVEIGGFVGSNEDTSGFALRDIIMAGSLTLNENHSNSGAMFGETGGIHLQNIISTIELRTNGATENIGYIYGVTPDDLDQMIKRSHYRHVFFNNQAAGAGETEGAFAVGRKLKVLTSSKFLKANGFDLENTYDHVEGKLPVVKINAPFPDGLAVKTGQSNNDTSISFGLRLSDGSRNFFVNLKNIYARQVATLQVVRAGKVAKTINSQVTNAVGNWFVNSKFKIKTGDVLRVKVAGKQISTLTVK